MNKWLLGGIIVFLWIIIPILIDTFFKVDLTYTWGKLTAYLIVALLIYKFFTRKKTKS